MNIKNITYTESGYFKPPNRYSDLYNYSSTFETIEDFIKFFQKQIGDYKHVITVEHKYSINETYLKVMVIKKGEEIYYLKYLFEYEHDEIDFKGAIHNKIDIIQKYLNNKWHMAKRCDMIDKLLDI